MFRNYSLSRQANSVISLVITFAVVFELGSNNDISPNDSPGPNIFISCESKFSSSTSRNGTLTKVLRNEPFLF